MPNSDLAKAALINNEANDERRVSVGFGIGYGEGIDAEQRDALEDLRTSFATFGPASEHIKTLYFQWELINLSRYNISALLHGISDR